MDQRTRDKDKDESRLGSQGPDRRHALEWGVGAFSAIAFLAMMGLLVYGAVTSRSDAPAFQFMVERVDPIEDGYHVSIRIVNTGDRVASSVEVEGALMRDGEAIETSGVTFDYLPSRSARRGGLVFQNDPSRFRLRLDVRGYADP